MQERKNLLLQQKRDNKLLIILFFSIIFHFLIIFTIHINIYKEKKSKGNFNEIELNLNYYNTTSFETEKLPITNIPQIPNIKTNSSENVDKNIDKNLKIQKEKIKNFKFSNLTDIPKFIPLTYPSSKNTKISKSFKSKQIGNSSNTADKNSKKILFSYLLLINKIIKKNVKYPFIAKKNGIEGKVIIQFKILKDGKVKDIKIVKSSGFKILDKSAIKAILSSVPFPGFPKKLERNSLAIKVPINFFLED